ncbi:MAG: toxic anion resistance protein [Acidimicrobiia bacterium]|nr:toxic anion resistance protein [Acidimicrobiia bacterium]
MTGETPAAAATLPPLDLSLGVDEAKAELAQLEPEPTSEIEQKAAEYASKLIALDPTDHDSIQRSREAVESMGRDLQRQAANRSRMLQAPIRDLSHSAEDGGPVAKSLTDLRIEVERLDPVSVDLDPGWFTRMVGTIPGVGTPLKRYFMRYESSQTVIDSIVKSLEKGRDQLKRDNITLGEDQGHMRELTHTLADQIALGQAIDKQLTGALAVETDETRRQFIEEELLFSLRQRIMDLQQQLAVNQQGVLATELIIRNNKELVRGVNRAIDVTVSALQVAVTVALALAHQKIVLDKVEAINATTSDIIAGTAERLRQQGTEIHRQASSSMLDMDSLRSAFADINAALDEISAYRRNALPQMAATIVEFDQLAEQSEEAIQKLEQGRDAATALDLDTDSGSSEAE